MVYLGISPTDYDNLTVYERAAILQAVEERQREQERQARKTH